MGSSLKTAYAGALDQAAPLPRMPEVQDRVVDLEHAIGDIETSITSLYSQLQAVLSQAHEGESAKGIATCARTAMGEKLDTLIGRARYANERLAELMHRLEV